MKPGDETLRVEVEFTKKDIGSLLCSALEGGSNYWYRLEKKYPPPDVQLTESVLGDKKIFPHIDYPLQGGMLTISDYYGVDGDESQMKKVSLDGAAILKGLRVMREKYSHHFADWLRGNDDATTGDVFLQCCLFGEVVYG